MRRILNSVLLILISCLLIQCKSEERPSAYYAKGEVLNDYQYIVYYSNGISDTVSFKAQSYIIQSERGTNSIRIRINNEFFPRVLISTSVPLKVLIVNDKK